jgi:hypothetical protein
MSNLKVVVLAGVSMAALLFPAAADSFAATAPMPTPSPCPPGQHHVGAKCVRNTPPKARRRTRTCAKGFHHSIFPPHRCVRNHHRPRPGPRPRPHPRPKPTHTPSPKPTPTHTP